MTKIRMADTPVPLRKPRRRQVLRYAVLLAMLGLAAGTMLSTDAEDPFEPVYRAVLRSVG